MDVRAYLRRIGYDGDTAPTIENLRAMHHAHFLHVPFENLDIARGVTIAVDEEVNFDKLVRRGRGGFCLELTGTFARALRQLGYRVDVIGARVFQDGQLGEPGSHMVAIVHLDEPWLVDVGFGGRVAEPLRLNEREPQPVGIRTYVIANDGDHYLVTCSEPGTPPMTYLFTMVPREFHEFDTVCRWLQTSPDSRFTRGDVVSLATDSGRITYAGGRLIVIENGDRTESDVPPQEVLPLLRERFRLELDEGAAATR